MNVAKQSPAIQKTDAGFEVLAGDVVYEFDKKIASIKQICINSAKLLDPDDVISGVELNVGSKVTDDRFVWPSGQISRGIDLGLNNLIRKPISLEYAEKGLWFCQNQRGG